MLWSILLACLLATTTICTKNTDSSVYQDYYQLIDFELNDRQLGEFFYIPGEGVYKNYTVVISPNPEKNSYLDDICDWRDEESKLVAVVVGTNTSVCLHKWEQGSSDIVFRSVVGITQTLPVYEFYMLARATDKDPLMIFKFVFSVGESRMNSTYEADTKHGEFSNLLTTLGISKKIPYMEIMIEVAPDLSFAETDDLSPRTGELIKWIVGIFILTIYFYTAILNESRYKIFGGKLYTFNGYMVVACVTNIFAMLGTLMFRFIPGYKPAFLTLFFIQVFLVLSLLYYIHSKSRTIVYQVLVPIYHVVAFIDWSVGAYLVHPGFLPVSWIVYGALFWAAKSAKYGAILGNEWRLSVSTAIDFTSIVLPFFLMKKGSMMYLQSHELCAIYKNNGYMVIYSLLMISVIPIAFIRVRITQYKLNSSAISSKQALDDYMAEDLGR